MKLFLIGMPGSGKSTVAKEFAKLKGIYFYDTDNLIEHKYKFTISEIFNQFGEPEFRKYEKYTLNEIINQNTDFIAATGGGLPCFYDNMNRMREAGTTVYLKTTVEILFERLGLNSDRPLLFGKTDKELLRYLKTVLKNRESFYLQAKYVIDAGKNINVILKSKPFNL